ncbi:MAG TPA: 5'/3'-nucleotidase SurE, partial [Nevskiaceae bacterium]|nr:5'/3'-nucleotidase SurE [Nevskiaceae bacterium]
IDAPGIAALAEAMKPLGEVIVVAPKTDQSGKSHSTTILGSLPKPIPVEHDGKPFGTAIDGTPADCVLAAVYWLSPDQKFDLVVSGINRGTNVGVGSLYSGTVGAAVEGALAKIPAIAFSQDSGRKEYAVSAQIAAKIVERAMKEGLAPYTLLNVNIPPGNPKGVKVASMGDSLYLLDHFETRGDVVKPILKRATELLPDRDTAFYAEGYVTIAPLTIDWTSRESLKPIERWELELPK